MAARRVLDGFALLALGVGLASVANAFPPCGHKACNDEAAASGLTGNAKEVCVKSLISDCEAGHCSCTGGSPPCSCVCGDGLCGPSEDCGTCPQDCGPCCGNGMCDHGETSSTCPQDCGAVCDCAFGCSMFCQCFDGTLCLPQQCLMSGPGTCQDLRFLCTDFCTAGHLGPRDCATTPCTECRTGQTCQ